MGIFGVFRLLSYDFFHSPVHPVSHLSGSIHVVLAPTLLTSHHKEFRVPLPMGMRFGLKVNHMNLTPERTWSHRKTMNLEFWLWLEVVGGQIRRPTGGSQIKKNWCTAMTRPVKKDSGSTAQRLY